VQDPDQLTEHVRAILARSISNSHSEDGQVLEVMTFDRDVETTIQEALHSTEQGAYLALEPGFAQGLINGLNKVLQNVAGANPVLLCTPTIRLHVKRLTERYLPGLAIISHNEIAPHLKVRSIGTVTVDVG
jgi:flagellar biosynthesis protein FlhA